MKPVAQVLTTLILICALQASVPAGEISCGVEGKAPCVTSAMPEAEPDAPGGAPEPTDETTWELVLTLLQGVLTVF